MTREEARNMLVAKTICLTRETSGTDTECNSHNCDNCGLNYEQGNMGEQKKALDMAIKALEQISHLTDRPCEVCEYHSDKGCSKWKCVFEGVNADECNL